MRAQIFAVTLALLAGLPAAQAGVTRSEANDGQLLMEDVPPIPESIARDLRRYQSTRWASFDDWTADGSGMYISTRFGEVEQIHRVLRPGGARTQLTFLDEPVGEVTRRPQGGALAFTMDAGGSEFGQVFLLEPGSGKDAAMLTDGKSRNESIVWNHAGGQIAYTSTRRNGASNDVWVMDVADPSSARLVAASRDGSLWAPVDYSPGDRRLLLNQYVGNADSRVHLLDLETGERRLLAGSARQPSSNFPVGFDAAGKGFWYVSDAGGEFQQLAWQSLQPGSAPEIVTRDIPWHVEEMALSDDRRRAAFSVNEDGFSRLYLLDPVTRAYRAVDKLPTGLLGGLKFSPDGRRLGMTLTSPRTPADAFSLELGRTPLEHGALTRWTSSEVGGLDTDSFVEPELVHYPTFDAGAGGPESIPAWLYRPAGDGPHPVVIVIHGGPEAQARPAFSSTYQMWLDKLGVAVLCPNVRGSNGYGKHYMNLDNGERREDSVRDIGALLDWIATRPDLDAGRVAVFGGSYGGYMVLASAVHYSDRLRAAVDIVGISNFVTFLENTQDYRRDLRRAEYGDEREPEMRAFLQAISPLNQVGKIGVPLFVVQGQNDPRVPVSESRQIVAALRERGQPVWYMNALNEGHGYRRKENSDIFQEATLMFLQRYLVGDPAR